MKRAGAQFPRKLWRQGVLASIAALCLTFLLTVVVFAGDVGFSDQAGVLNQAQIRNAAGSLRYPLNIYTVNNFTGTTNAFDQRAATHITSNNIVISISTNLQHVSIQYGKNVPLRTSGTDSAVNAFISSYKSNRDYTAATISSINSLNSTLGSSAPSNNVPSNNSGTHTTSASNNSGIYISGLGCVVGLIILGLILFFVLRRNRNRPQIVNPNYGQPSPPNYGQSYPPNYGQPYPQQNQGVNPWVAGGLGAAAGGFLGYELGKQQGEREAKDAGYYGGNSGGDGGGFGGGSSGDFGGGGGDFGGGSSGDFGGGGGDFGGGSSGGF